MKLKRRSLFIKIFFWFWLVTTLTGLTLFVIAVIGDSARNSEVQNQRAEERRQRMGETLSFFGETAIGIMNREGIKGLDEYSRQLARTAGIRPYFFLNDSPLSSFETPQNVLELASQVRQSGKTEYVSLENDFLLGIPLKNSSGRVYIIIVGITDLDTAEGRSPAIRRPPPEAVDACRGLAAGDECSFQGPRRMIVGECQDVADMPLFCVPQRSAGARRPHPSTSGRNIQPAERSVVQNPTVVAKITGGLDRYSRDLGKYLVIMFIIGGFACYFLTWHLTAPLRRLRSVAQKLADGDLSARVGKELNRRGDEISDLGCDLDRMAERIEDLIGSQNRLLRDISHELRSPLSRLNVALELVRHSPVDSEAFLDRIERESIRLNELISQLLTLTKLESENSLINKKNMDLTALVEEIAADVDFEANNVQRRVEILSSPLLKMKGNRELLRQAIENIIRNAIRYTKEGTAVELTLTAQGSRAVIDVRDHGLGVPENELSKIFLPFYRISDGRERESGGVGVGLAISERAIRIHRGTIRAFNAGDGGLIVRIELPLI